jgi:putative acetyltransferase
MELRPATAADVQRIVSLVRDTLAEFGLEFGSGATTDDQLYGLPGSYRDPGGEFFVVYEAEVLLGTAGVAPVAQGVFELRKMYLAPQSRGRGIGKLLLAACVAHCRSRGATQIVLDTIEKMTAAIAFYERHGFVRDDAQIRGARCERGYRLDLAK